VAITIVGPADGQPRIVVLDDELVVIGRSQADDDAYLKEPLSLEFCGPDTLITLADGGTLRSWEVDGTAVRGRADFDYDRAHEHYEHGRVEPVPPLLWATPVPSVGEVAVGATLKVAGGRTLTRALVLDARVLTPVGGAPSLRGNWRWRQPVADGDYMAWWGGGLGAMLVYDVRLGVLHELARKPLSQARPADIELLEAAASRALPPGAETAVSLLLACLRYRFEL
jgi:hypothetical protein